MVGKRVRVHFSAAALVNALVQKHGIAIRSGRGICWDHYGLFPGAYPFSCGRIFHSVISSACLTKILDCDAAPELQDEFRIWFPKILWALHSLSFLLRLRHQHKQLALQFSELIHIAHVIGEPRHHRSSQSVGELRCVSSCFH